MSEEKKKKNLITYALVMILAAIFIIIIAAMADNREDQFESQLSEQTQINMGIQNRIVSLEDENYKLKKEAEEKDANLAREEQAAAFYQALSQIYRLSLEGNTEEAAASFLEIDETNLTEEQKAAYTTLQKQLQLPEN